MPRGKIRWAIVAALLAVVAVVVIYILVIELPAGTGEASEPISAPQLAAPTAAPVTARPATAAPTTAAPTPAATEDPTPVAMSDPEPTPTAAPEPTATPAPTPAATAAPTPTAAPTATAVAAEPAADGVPSAAVLYRIVPEESEVRFEIDEILRGAPTLVIGTTNQVAGDFIIDFGDLAASQLGPVRINVRTLRTDEERRDRAIRSRILESASDQYEFTTFEPVRLEGLPGSLEMGQTVPFQIVGNLAIRDITREVVFDAELTVVSPDRVEGTAVTTILRGDYNLTIPNVPFVASVDEDVLLAISFVAVAVSE